jgi:hypothetical protein
LRLDGGAHWPRSSPARNLLNPPHAPITALVTVTFFTVQQRTLAMVQGFGRFTREVSPGLHVKARELLHESDAALRLRLLAGERARAADTQPEPVSDADATQHAPYIRYERRSAESRHGALRVRRPSIAAGRAVDATAALRSAPGCRAVMTPRAS